MPYLYNSMSGQHMDIPYLVDTSGKKFTGSIYGGSYPSTVSYLIVGNGNTAPTEDDYNLESPLDIVRTQRAMWTDKGLILIGVFHNKTSEPVTITEVALKFGINNYSDTTSGNGYVILSRDLINPITIPSDESRTIQYTIEF